MTLTTRILAISLCLGLCLPAFCRESQWVEVHSPHFSVITDTNEKRGRDIALRFEQMRAVFGSLMTKANVNTPVPLQIIAFRNSKEMRQFAPIWRGKPTNVAGLFQSGSDRCFILLDMSADDPWQVVFHEYAHQLMDGTLAEQLDPWFEEGFAEYFRTITVDGKEANVGKIPEDEYLILDQRGWMKVSDLFRVQQYSDAYNGNDGMRDVMYAESGMLVHYLYDNGLILKTGDYFNLTRDKHVPVDAAIQQAFGMTPPQFDKALRKYEASQRFRYYKLPTPAGIDSKTYTSAPISSLNAQAALADAHLHSQDYQQKAREEFEALLKVDPDNASALRGLGYSYLIKQDYDKAGEYFHKSAALNSNDPRVLYYSALLSYREGAANFQDTSRAERMQKELEQSIKLDPNFADSYNILAVTYRMQRKPDLAIAACQKAILLNPRNVQYRFNLAQLYLDDQKVDDAAIILRSLESANDPAIAAQAQQQLRQIESFRSRQTAAIQFSQPRPSERPTDTTATHEVQVVNSSSEPVQVLPPQPAKFLHGRLISVDCSSPPAATLTVVAGGVTWKMHTANSAKTILIGADQLSCSWTKQKVAVNYRPTGDQQGEIISLEVQ